MAKTSKILGARSLEKALDLLYSFEPGSAEQSLSQISRKLRFPPSTARRLLKVLISRDLIQQDPITQLYRLGSGIRFLASVIQNDLDLRKVALPVMEALRNATGENTSLHEFREGKRICIEKVESKEVLRDTILIGDQFPAHSGASGKVLLAFLEEDGLRKYLQSGPLKALTPRTITDPKKLMAELGKIRRNGFGFSSGERVMDGLCAISAPIFDAEGTVRHSLTITLTPFRLHAKGRERLVRLVTTAAADISKKLGGALATKTQQAAGGRVSRAGPRK
jgi:DNA-binding IclR family transcriptional regulator